MPRSSVFVPGRVWNQQCWPTWLLCGRASVDSVPKEELQQCSFSRKEDEISSEAVLADVSTVDTLPEFSFGSELDSDAECESEVAVGDADMEKLSRFEVDLAMFDQVQVQPWVTNSFQFCQTLQAAPRNHGSVDLMESIDSGTFVAVKKMPNTWMTADANAFRKLRPGSSEQPWLDLALVSCLQKRSFPYLCKLSGVFRDASSTYVVSSYATEGDLLGWSDEIAPPGKARTAVITPIMRELFTAVKLLHNLGIAHADLSLENVVLTRDREGCLHVKLIDFGMASLARNKSGPVRAKPSYTAPEGHEHSECDLFLADSFALGVILFGMVAHDYIWLSTKPGACERFSMVKRSGLRQLVERRRVRTDAGSRRCEEFLPESIIDSIVGLSAFNPSERMTLGETCWDAQLPRLSIWDMSWLSLEK